MIRALLFAFLLIGCSNPSNTLPYPLTISEEGLGAIHPNTPFDQIGSTLSGFEFEKLSQISADQNTILFLMKRGNTILAQIVSDPSGKKISAIHILSPMIKNKQNIGIGDPFVQTQTSTCLDTLCTYDNEPSVYYRIDRNSRIIHEIIYQRL